MGRFIDRNYYYVHPQFKIDVSPQQYNIPFKTGAMFNYSFSKSQSYIFAMFRFKWAIGLLIFFMAAVLTWV